MTSWSDHFSAVAGGYAEFRPGYPEELFRWLRSVSPSGGLLLECGAGSGQASAGLARHFDRVVATEPSLQQLTSVDDARSFDRLAASAELLPMRKVSCDAIVVAQALHWFDLTKFYGEVRRVARRGALVAAWSYAEMAISADEPQQLFASFYGGDVAPFWPPERHHVDTHYAELAFPFPRIDPPTLTMSEEWNLAQLLGYIGTWSATSRMNGGDGGVTLAAFAERLSAAWGDPLNCYVMSWPLTILAGRVE